MKKRLISVCLTLPLFLIIMFYDKVIYLFHLAILAISILSASEIFYMAKVHRQKNLRTVITTMIAMVLGYIITICDVNVFRGDFSNLYKIVETKHPSMDLSLVMVFALIAILFIINMFKVHVSTFEEKGRAILTAVFCFIYVGLGVWHISLMRFMPSGKYYIVFILLCAWLSDTGGYIVGRKLGKHKLSNSASPNKSYEGLVGMFIFTIPFSILYYFLYSNGYLSYLLGNNIPNFSFPQIMLLTVIFTFTGFLGDMGESFIKRMYDTKDSSKLFPGHGGVFDIFDSVILTAPISYYVFLLLQ
ncbi:phosphatidate cytidylyltransferase [Brachyspira hyodysenteriae]|uniref:phosphatidate cytidylyltransferase n=1 Tax=Brachyspira hyodysenteriae TaxID=159 RepID=UPI0022CD652E|nr:phosphatidate cytidylyltransferase [Brachyspira hyodysenteriae]MCZ9848898.1 phosphatidate cytidylyltransferase [Brachyspira hyodysenteriae]MCZ9872259.1 phosphatidate cytidylyltransferase [Brachyspira hyodysenteriae]MCZ9893398.1 phosphatidate cytidylyltransferase [Brachyspira hyodysenteriae]MCZ9990942.1 phosphatidate cytidylyltransferase [Brachyspira hyodysenteriae]MCZ9999306.1 phosphatidate cytidylyltransferase [Brachyspira hyodysenteriae]